MYDGVNCLNAITVDGREDITLQWYQNKYILTVTTEYCVSTNKETDRHSSLLVCPYLKSQSILKHVN